MRKANDGAALGQRHIPAPDRAVGARARQGASVRREGYAPEAARLDSVRMEGVAGGGVPEPDDALVAAGGQNPVVGRERDTLNPRLVATASGQHLPAAHVPDLDRM